MSIDYGRDYSEPVLPDPFGDDLERRTLPEVHAVFGRWLGADYDLQALDAVLATAAVEQLDGDPAWLLMISGSGNAKTETVAALAGAGAVAVSTITSEGALLSATGKRDRAADATGGLLRRVGGRVVVVIKDVTSVLSMNRDTGAVAGTVKSLGPAATAVAADINNARAVIGVALTTAADLAKVQWMAR